MKASAGVKEDGFKSCTNRLPPSIPVRLRIHAVMVVPMLAPMIILMACLKLMRPELTKPTTMTVVAEELCMTAVTPIPVSSPASLPVVSRSSRARRCPPALRSRACPMRLMPNRNRLKPPVRVSKLKMSMTSFLS